MTGTAVLFHGPGAPLESARLPLPTPGAGEALVRITRCTLCRSDLHSHSGRRTQAVPCVLGHEIVGRIQSLGSPMVDLRGIPLSLGDRVTWTIHASCGTCANCRRGIPQKCAALFKYGHEAGRAFTGGLASHVLLRAGTGIVKTGLDDTVAAPLNCAFATVAAMLRAGGDIAGRSVLILGAGMLGLAACALARHLGAGAIRVLDADAERQSRAERFGAGGTQEEPDLVLELAGTSEAVAQAISSARIGGTVVLAGTVHPVPPMPLDPEMVVRRLLTIRGVHNYAPQDLLAAVDFLESTSYPFHERMGETFPLHRAEEALARAHASPGQRIAVTMEDA